MQPPRWPLRLVRVLLKEEYMEEIEGDMNEMFEDNIARVGLRRARLYYVLDVFKLLRPALMRNMEGVERLNTYGMFKNYFKISVRGLMKNPVNSFINIFGLAVAIGIAVFAYGFAQWTYATDQFHQSKDNVFLVTFYARRDGTEQAYGSSPAPLADLMREDFAHIRNVCQVEDRHLVVKFDDHVFVERIRHVNPAFLEMFTFPMKWGNAAALNDLSSIILSEEASMKYFGEDNPVGQTLLVKYTPEQTKAFKIAGVSKRFPDAHTIDFDFLVNLDNLKGDAAFDPHDWSKLVRATFIQLDQPGNILSIQRGMDKYRALQHEAVHDEWAITSFGFEPLATLHIRSEEIKDDISSSSKGNYESIVYLTIITILLLALACFNYINIAIVTAAKRLKEIGVRKSIGANRMAVMIQFLSENIVVTMLALVVGVALGIFLFIPWFENMWHFSMEMSLTDTRFWIYLAIVLFVTGITSGFYPSLYISSFQVVSILKGSTKFGSSSPLTRTLLGIQFGLACMFMTIAITFLQNNIFLANRSWGYEQHGALYARVPDAASFRLLRDQMLQVPDVVEVAGSVQHVGRGQGAAVIHVGEREYEVDAMDVSANYFKTLGIQLSEGRSFHGEEGSDKQSVIVNELLAKNMKWDHPVGQQFKIDTLTYEVVGVVKDFHSYSFFKPVRPLIFRVADKSDYIFLSIRTRQDAEVKTFRTMQAKWSALFPEVPFVGGYQEDVWGNYENMTRNYVEVWEVFTSLALILASLGLYGLVSLNVSGRIREFSIRKVLGAGTSHISGNIIRPYIFMFGIALVIAAPLSAMAGNFILSQAYAYRMPFSYSGAVITVTVLMTVMLATISTQIRRVVKESPVAGLKVE